MDHLLGPFPCLLLLPTEIQHQIFGDLPYPDLLSLKLVNAYFYNNVETTVRDRADWLLDRAQRSLMIPRQSKCLLRSDAEFCSHPEVLQILRWRRKHLDCREPGGWCREVSGVQCKNRWATLAHPYRWYTLYDIFRGLCRQMAALCAYPVEQGSFLDQCLACYAGCIACNHSPPTRNHANLLTDRRTANVEKNDDLLLQHQSAFRYHTMAKSASTSDMVPQTPIRNQVVIAVSPLSNLLTKPISSPPQHIEWNADTPHVHT